MARSSNIIDQNDTNACHYGHFMLDDRANSIPSSICDLAPMPHTYNQILRHLTGHHVKGRQLVISPHSHK